MESTYEKWPNLHQGVGEAIGKKTEKKEKKIKMTSVRTKRALDTLRGQKVIGRNEVDGYYYPGRWDIDAQR